MLFNVVNEKDPRIRITILRPSGIAAMTGSAAPPNNRQFRCIAEFVCPVPLRDLSTCSKARAYSISLSATASVESGIHEFGAARWMSEPQPCPWRLR